MATPPPCESNVIVKVSVNAGVFTTTITLLFAAQALFFFAERIFIYGKRTPLMATAAVAALLTVVSSAWEITYFLAGRIFDPSVCKISYAWGVLRNLSTGLAFLHLLLRADAANVLNPRWPRWRAACAALLVLCAVPLALTPSLFMQTPRRFRRRVAALACVNAFPSAAFVPMWVLETACHVAFATAFCWPLLRHARAMRAAAAASSNDRGDGGGSARRGSSSGGSGSSSGSSGGSGSTGGSGEGGSNATASVTKRSHRSQSSGDSSSGGGGDGSGSGRGSSGTAAITSSELEGGRMSAQGGGGRAVASYTALDSNCEMYLYMVRKAVIAMAFASLFTAVCAVLAVLAEAGVLDDVPTINLAVLDTGILLRSLTYANQTRLAEGGGGGGRSSGGGGARRAGGGDSVLPLHARWPSAREGGDGGGGKCATEDGRRASAAAATAAAAASAAAATQDGLITISAQSSDSADSSGQPALHSAGSGRDVAAPFHL